MSPRSTTVTLSLRECEAGALPPVCAKCGATATGETAVGFYWFPEAIGLLGILSNALFAVVALFNLSRRTVSMPVCGRHAWVWHGARVLFVGTLLVFVPPLVNAFDDGRKSVRTVSIAVCCVGLFVGLVAGLRVAERGVRPLLINDIEIELTNLHPDFVDAVENHSPEKQAAYDALRAARNAGVPRA